MKSFAILMLSIAMMSPARGIFADDFSAFYPVDQIGGTTEKHIFDLDETPYIYANLPDKGLDFWVSEIDTTWLFGAVQKDAVSRQGLNQLEFWFTSPNWPSIKEPGLWNVPGDFDIKELNSGQTVSSGSGFTSFTVVPEPLTATLFLTGGATLIALRFVKKKS